MNAELFIDWQADGMKLRELIVHYPGWTPDREAMVARWGAMNGVGSCNGCKHLRLGHWDDAPFCVHPEMTKLSKSGEGLTLIFGVDEPCGELRKLKSPR